MEEPKLSVIMASYSRPEALRANLKSLCYWPSVKDCEVVISDDASPDVEDIRAVVNEFWDKVRIQFYEIDAERGGRPWFYREVMPNGGHYNSATLTYNVSLRRARAPLFLFCGYDLLHVLDNVEAALRLHQEDCFTIGTEYASTEVMAQELYKSDWEDPRTFLKKEYLRKVSVSIKRQRKLLHIGCLSRKAVMTVGGMNELLLGGFAFSDVDFATRLELAGYKPVFTNEMFCIHPWHERPDSLYAKSGNSSVTSVPYHRNRVIVKLMAELGCVNPNDTVMEKYYNLSWGPERAIKASRRWFDNG